MPTQSSAECKTVCPSQRTTFLASYGAAINATIKTTFYRSIVTASELSYIMSFNATHYNTIFVAHQPTFSSPFSIPILMSLFNSNYAAIRSA